MNPFKMANSLTTESIIALLSPDQLMDLFNALDLKIADKRENTLLDKIKDYEKKYFDLIWASSAIFNGDQPSVSTDAIKQKYLDEWNDLFDEDFGHFNRGFANGCLATVRLLHSYALPHNYREDFEFDSDEEPFILTRQYEIEQAELDFPFLDT